MGTYAHLVAGASVGRMFAWARLQAKGGGPEEVAEWMLRYCLQCDDIRRAVATAYLHADAPDCCGLASIRPKGAGVSGGVPDVVIECSGCELTLQVELKIDATFTRGQKESKYWAGSRNLIVCPEYRRGQVDTEVNDWGWEGEQQGSQGKPEHTTWVKFCEAISRHLPVDLGQWNRHQDLLAAVAAYGEMATTAVEPVGGTTAVLDDQNVLEALAKTVELHSKLKGMQFPGVDSLTVRVAKSYGSLHVDTDGKSVCKGADHRTVCVEFDPSYTDGKDLAWPWWIRVKCGTEKWAKGRYYLAPYRPDSEEPPVLRAPDLEKQLALLVEKYPDAGNSDDRTAIPAELKKFEEARKSDVNQGPLFKFVPAIDAVLSDLREKTNGVELKPNLRDQSSNTANEGEPNEPDLDLIAKIAGDLTCLASQINFLTAPEVNRVKGYEVAGNLIRNIFLAFIRTVDRTLEASARYGRFCGQETERGSLPEAKSEFEICWGAAGKLGEVHAKVAISFSIEALASDNDDQDGSDNDRKSALRLYRNSQGGSGWEDPVEIPIKDPAGHALPADDFLLYLIRTTENMLVARDAR